MGVIVKGFKDAGLFAKVAFLLLIVAALSSWIAFTCTGWGVNKRGGIHLGLWRWCTDDVYSPGCKQVDGTANDWWAATQALATFGFLGINVALLLTILYMFVPSCTKDGELAVAATIVCIGTGFLYLTGVIVFAANFDDDFVKPAEGNLSWPEYELGYSFGLSIVALLFEIIAGVFIILDAKKGGTTPSS